VRTAGPGGGETFVEALVSGERPVSVQLRDSRGSGRDAPKAVAHRTLGRNMFAHLPALPSPLELVIAIVGLEKNKFATVPGGARRSKICCYSRCIATARSYRRILVMA
jgi:hypothetical protein